MNVLSVNIELESRSFCLDCGIQYRITNAHLLLRSDTSGLALDSFIHAIEENK